MKTKIFLSAMAVGMILGPVAQAAPVYGTSADLTGSRDTTGGLEFVRGNPSGALNLDWNITNNGDGTFNYQYTFSGDNLQNPSISHLTLDLSDDCIDPGDPNCVTGFEISGDEVSSSDEIEIEFGDIDEIDGAVKFDAEGENINDTNLIYSFTSNRAPVWGDIFIAEGIWDAANVGFGNRTSEDTTIFVARPNGPVTEVPVPATLFLFGFILTGLGLLARRIEGARNITGRAGQ